jgi:GNAT superfamily N-acetyltransferase
VQRPDIILTDTIDPAVNDVVSHGLNVFNHEIVGYTDRKPIAVVVRDPNTGAPVGGAIGRSSLGLLFLDLFYLPESIRGAGVGSEVLRMFEAEGKRRGCAAAVLYTISFQAPGFYERHGWRRFGEIACEPAGTSRIFMTKPL